MNVAGRITCAVLGLSAPEALADHHGMAMHDGGGGSTVATSVSLLAAAFATPDFEGDYEGVIPAVTWSSPHWAAGANVPMYRLQENGREDFGLGDIVVHGQGTFIDAGNVHAGGLLAVSAPTGNGQTGFGMGHPMAMPALWGAWSLESVTLAGSAGFSRALVDEMSHHDHGPWPLVEPMNMSEISWSASGDLALSPSTHAGARLSGGVPVGAPGHDRIVGSVRLAWGAGRVDTAAEIQAGLAGDPFTVRGVLETALHF
jgi:hypothetical protein